MIDIVERIRNRINDAPMPTEYLLDEAADEIERLRSALKIIAGSSDWLLSRQAASALDNIGPDT